MSILRLFLAVVLVLVIGAFAFGYLSGGRTFGLPTRAESSDTVNRARDGAAAIGEKAGVAATKVESSIGEATLTTKIKAKMALDDTVKARSIDVTTRGTTVTLSGIVTSKEEHDRAMSLARETEGVTDVVDDLKMLQRVG